MLCHAYSAMNFDTHPRMFHKSQQGLSLVELMVAISVGLILLAGVLQIFISSKQTYRVNDALARLQENGRYAMYLLSKDIRMAGFTGCGSAIPTVNVIADVDSNKIP